MVLVVQVVETLARERQVWLAVCRAVPCWRVEEVVPEGRCRSVGLVVAFHWFECRQDLRPLQDRHWLPWACLRGCSWVVGLTVPQVRLEGHRVVRRPVVMVDFLHERPWLRDR